MERETGFEPATSTLARLHSTTELLPLWAMKGNNRERPKSRKCFSLPGLEEVFAECFSEHLRSGGDGAARVGPPTQC